MAHLRLMCDIDPMNRILLTFLLLTLGTASHAQPEGGAMPPFDLTTGNAAIQVIIPAVDPIFFEDVTVHGGDPSILIRYTTLIVNSWFDASTAYHKTAVGVYSTPEKAKRYDPADNSALNAAMIAASKVILDACFPQHAERWEGMMADALGDQLYILAGTMMRHGMQDVIAKVFREIQASNMSKLGSDGAPILREDGKVMKGPNYFRPNIAGILDADASARSKAPSQVPLDKLAWSVNNDPVPLDRLSHAEMVSDSVEVAEEVNLMV